MKASANARALSFERPALSTDQQATSEDEDRVYLRATWLLTSLRHPVWRLTVSLARIVGYFFLCASSPLLASTKTPGYFPVYGDLLGTFSSDVSVGKVVLHLAVLALAVVFVRLVVYRAWFERLWNWGEQYAIARSKYVRLSRTSLDIQTGLQGVRVPTTIPLRVYASGISEQCSTRVLILADPKAQGSWTLVATSTPFLWLVVTSVLRQIVKNTDYDVMLFGSSLNIPQWHVQLIVYQVVMLISTLSFLVTLDGILQDRHYSRALYGNWMVRLRRVYQTSAIFRVLFCWTSLIGIIVWCIGFGGFNALLTAWENWNLDFLSSSKDADSIWLSHESWRAMCSGLVVVLDLLWLVQEWHFPHFSSTLGVKIFGATTESVQLSAHHLHFTSKWVRCFIVLGLLLPLQLCQFFQDFLYTPNGYQQVAEAKKSGNRLVGEGPYDSTIDIPIVIERLIKEGSISRYFDWSLMDRVPSLALVVLMLCFGVLQAKNENWFLVHAAFLGRRSRKSDGRGAQTEKNVNRSATLSATRLTLKEQLHLHKLYHLRGQTDVTCCCLAMLSVLTVIFQVRCIWQADLSLEQSSERRRELRFLALQGPGETFGMLLIMITCAMVYLLSSRYSIQYKILVLRKQLPAPATGKSQLWWKNGTWRMLFLPFLAELMVCGLCLPPLFHGHIHLQEERYIDSFGVSSCPSQMVDASDVTSDGPTSCELRYVYPVEVLNLVVLLRLYWFVRLLRYELLRRLFNTHSGVMLLTSGIGRNHLSEMSSLRRSFRICFSLVPGKIVGGLFIVLWFGTAAAVSILERPFPSLLDQEEHSLWLTIVTMSTVGYGDAYPLTAAGRFTVIIGAVLGGALVIALMTSLFLGALKGSKNEHKFVLALERFAWEKNLQRASANLIAAAWRSYQIQKKQVASELVNKVDRADMLLRMAHEFKLERKQRQPKGTNDSAEQLRVQSIMRWRTTQLDGWLKTCQSEKKQVLDAMQAELKTIEQSMQQLLA